jgi:hypothetical protein
MPDRIRTFSPRPAAVVALLFVLTLPAVTTRFYASDEVEFYAWLRSAAFDRDVDFDNEYRYFYDSGAVRNDGFRTTFLDEVNEAGRRRNFTPIGTALLWAPFFAIGHAAAALTGAPTDGFSQPYISAVAVGSAIYGGMALLLTWAICRRAVGAGGLATALVWLGTPLVFYMYVAPGFSHAGSAFAVSLFLWIWLLVRERWTPGGAAALGAAAALMAMVREQDAFLVVGPAIDFVRWAAGSRPGGRPLRAGRATPGRAAAVALTGMGTAVLIYLPQLLAYAALNGHPGPTREVSRKMSWSSPHAFGVLWSPEHGLFFWTPLALVAVLGLLWLAAGGVTKGRSDARWIATVALVMFAVQVYVSGSVESWTVAGSFGQRRFVGITPILALGLSAWVVSIRAAGGRAPGMAAAVVGVLLVWWNVGLMAQFGLHLMDRQRLSIRENARMTFTRIPRELPSLALQYMTDRASLFRRPRQE